MSASYTPLQRARGVVVRKELALVRARTPWVREGPKHLVCDHCGEHEERGNGTGELEFRQAHERCEAA